MPASLLFTVAGSWAGAVQAAHASLYFVLAIQGGQAQCAAGIVFPLESEASISLPGSSCTNDAFATSFAHGAETYQLHVRLRGEQLVGALSSASYERGLTLVPLRPLAREELLPFCGDYADDAGNSYVFAESLGNLYFFDRGSGRTGRLFPLQPGRFFGGPSWLVYQPTTVLASFSTPEEGFAQNVTISVGDRIAQLHRVRIETARDVEFDAPNAKIAGTLHLPLGNGPFPAILMLAGSNGQPRSGFYGESAFIADQFVRLGVAVLTFDKRGVGASSGSTGDNGVEDVAASAFSYLRSQPFVDRQRIGVAGFSEGGIIAPRVAHLVPGVTFIINSSGAVVDAITQELERTALQLKADGFDQHSVDDAVAFQQIKFHYAQTGQGWDDYLAAYQRYQSARWFPDPYVGPPAARDSEAWTFWRESGSIHPADYWRSFDGPVLLIYGEHDVLSDADADVALFVDAMRQARNKTYTIARIPDAEHSMLVAKTGSSKETRTLTSYSLGYFRLLGEWLQLSHVIPSLPAASRLGDGL